MTLHRIFNIFNSACRTIQGFLLGHIGLRRYDNEIDCVARSGSGKIYEVCRYNWCFGNSKSTCKGRSEGSVGEGTCFTKKANQAGSIAPRGR